MKKPFFWLIAFFMLLFGLGVWLLVMGIRSSPLAFPFVSSM